MLSIPCEQTCIKNHTCINVSGVDALKTWLNRLSLDDNAITTAAAITTSKEAGYDSDSDGSGDSGDLDEIGQEFGDDHVCYIGEDCSNPDCIDCVDNFEADTPDDSEDSDPDYFQAIVNSKIADCDSDCGCSNCEGDYDDYCEMDSVS